MRSSVEISFILVTSVMEGQFNVKREKLDFPLNYYWRKVFSNFDQ